MARSLFILPILLVVTATTAFAQCPRPLAFELGGRPGPICSASINYQAVGRGRFVSIESTPFSGAPSVVGRVQLDSLVVHMHTEILGHVWATDGLSIYGIDSTNPANPQIVGRIALAGEGYSSPFGITRLRVRGNFVYAVGPNSLYIIDITNPAAPVLRSTMVPSNAYLNDVEVTGSFAYVAIIDNSAPRPSLLVVDVGDPIHPAEIRRVGSGARRGLRVSFAFGNANLYALSADNSSGALEMWNLSAPSNPSLSVVNASLNTPTISDEDDLRATSTCLCLLDRHNSNSIDYLRIYSNATLASLANPVSFPDGVNGINPSLPFVYLTRKNGYLGRVDITDTGFPISFPSYLDVPPGECNRIANIGHGFSIVAGPNDLWLYATYSASSGSPPACTSHIGADTGYSFGGTPIAILSDNTVIVREANASSTYLVAYVVNTSPSPGLFWQGVYAISGIISGLEGGFDQNGNRRVYYTIADAAGNCTLHTLNANNLGAMTHLSSTSLTAGVSGPLKYFNPSGFPSQPERLVIGGTNGKTQILSVAGTPVALGVMPSSASSIAQGLPPAAWLLDSFGYLRGYDITQPTAPILRSSILVPGNPREIKTTDAFALSGAVACEYGVLTRLNLGNLSSPFITQIATVADADLNSLAYDGSQIHAATPYNGYEVIPLSFSAPPAEDPNAAIHQLGNRGLVPLCPGAPLSMAAHFLASPAVTSYQWMTLDFTTGTYSPLSDGPSAGGGTLSGTGSAMLTISNPGAGDALTYACRATNSCGSAISSYATARLGGYANCDNSTVQPVLNVNDFQCFLNLFAAQNPYANCDGSTSFPALNVNDFQCFLNEFASACHR